MNLRISVVVLAAGLFMAIWNADQRAIQKQAIAIRERNGAAVASAGILHNSPSGRSATTLLSEATNAVAAMRTANDPEGSPLPPVDAVIPLPTNLGSGTWAAVSEDGSRTVITVHQSPAGENAEQHFCIVTDLHKRRWCFVRTPADRIAKTSKSHD